MSRYQIQGDVQVQFELGSRNRVLRNKLHIRHVREMDRREFDALLQMQTNYYTRLKTNTQFTEDLICRMHRDWLGAIYEWGGVYRTVELSKPGFRWPPAHLVAQNMATFANGALKQCTPCRGNSLDEIAEKLAIVHAEFLLVHPFRDGNGRLARSISDVMAMQAGYAPPRFGLVGKGSGPRKKAYIRAVTSGYGRDYRPLTVLFREALIRDFRRPPLGVVL